MPTCPKCGHTWPYPSQDQRVHWKTGYDKAGEPTVQCGQHLKSTVAATEDPKKFTCWRCKRAYLAWYERTGGKKAREEIQKKLGWEIIR